MSQVRILSSRPCLVEPAVSGRLFCFFGPVRRAFHRSSTAVHGSVSLRFLAVRGFSPSRISLRLYAAPCRYDAASVFFERTGRARDAGRLASRTKGEQVRYCMGKASRLFIAACMAALAFACAAALSERAVVAPDALQTLEASTNGSGMRLLPRRASITTPSRRRSACTSGRAREKMSGSRLRSTWPTSLPTIRCRCTTS